MKMQSLQGITIVAAIATLLVMAGTAQAQRAHTLYASKCAGCHANDGSGNTSMGQMMHIPSFKSPAVQKMTNAKLRVMIANGKAPMPAFKGQLTNTQIGELVQYVRTLAKRK